MRGSRTVVLLLTALAAGCLAPASPTGTSVAEGDDGLTTVRIITVDALHGFRVAGVEVRLEVPGVGTLVRTTDEAGQANATLRPSATCRLTFNKPGYQSAAATVACVEDQDLQVPLRPLQAPSGQSSNATEPEPSSAVPDEPPPVPSPFAAPHVTVATFDTGLNPFHPAWRSSRDARLDLDLPDDAFEVSLRLTDDFNGDWLASQAAWSTTQATDRLMWFNGTRLLAIADAGDPTAIFDRASDAHSHGARASSQISGTGFAVADHAYVVGLDMIGGTVDNEPFVRAYAGWVADQDWIDVVHINFGFPAPWPGPLGLTDAVHTMVQSGKLVVLPALNGAGNGGTPYPMEFGQLTHVPGTLVAGANDQCAAGSYWSNLNPHVVMDGTGTAAAQSIGYGDDDFSGTSSSSPRIAGYAAEALYQVRLALNISAGMRDGALIVLEPGAQPANGPLSDGRLEARELHEAIRKTARPTHDSWLDGYGFVEPCPPLPDAGEDDYAKVGYGEVSDLTLPDLVAVLLGTQPLPERAEDTFYEASEDLRHQIAGV